MSSSSQHTEAGRIRRAFGMMLTALTLVAGVACEGENLFTGESEAFQPRVSEVSVPPVVFAGDTVRVRVTAAGARRISQILVSVRGAVQADTVLDAATQQQQLSAVVAIPIPDVIQDTLLVVQARAADALGVVSRVKEAFALVFGPPVVTSVSAPAGVRAGERINIDVRAFGARRIARLDLSARGAVTTDTSIVLANAVSSVNELIILQIPNTVEDTLIALSVQAVDLIGGMSAPRTALVPFAIDTPSIAIAVPPSVEAGKTLNLGILAQSLRHITELRIEIRGGATADLVMRMTPTRARTLEFISWPLPGNLSTPELRVRAFALDRANTLSATSVHNVSVPQGAPTVELVDPYSSTVDAGHFVDVRTQVTSVRPVKEVWFRWRGFSAQALSSLIGGPDTRLTINPPRNSVLEDAAVEAPCVRADAVFLILVSARDVDEAISPIVTNSISVTGNAFCSDPADSIPIPDTTTAGPRVRNRSATGMVRDRESGDLNGRDLSLLPAQGASMPIEMPLGSRGWSIHVRGRKQRAPRKP
ncbi:MAG: hypothetical protein L0271_01950 [Gemmatimonadetes bacterium]|nr:hypothetical protein [Gemmatimonadota bacterium]